MAGLVVEEGNIDSALTYSFKIVTFKDSKSPFSVDIIFSEKPTKKRAGGWLGMKSKGQGFGLAVVKRLTEALGGTVAFESEVGRGTKVIVMFPLITQAFEYTKKAHKASVH